MTKKKETKRIKVRDLKPKKDAKGGLSHQTAGSQNQTKGQQISPNLNLG